MKDKEANTAKENGKKHNEVSVDLLADPFTKLEEAINNKFRNLEKRRSKLEQVKVEDSNGGKLSEEQQEAILKLPEVELQLDFVKKMQKLVMQQHRQYQRAKRLNEISEAKKLKEEAIKKNDKYFRECIVVVDPQENN